MHFLHALLRAPLLSPGWAAEDCSGSHPPFAVTLSFEVRLSVSRALTFEVNPVPIGPRLSRRAATIGFDGGGSR